LTCFVQLYTFGYVLFMVVHFMHRLPAHLPPHFLSCFNFSAPRASQGLSFSDTIHCTGANIRSISTFQIAAHMLLGIFPLIMHATNHFYVCLYPFFLLTNTFPLPGQCSEYSFLGCSGSSSTQIGFLMMN